MAKKLKAAIIAQDLRHGGGVAQMARFSKKCLAGLGIEADIYSYAPFKWNRECSVSLFHPGSLLKPQIGHRVVQEDGVSETVVGSYFPEIEWMRYLPHGKWKELLSSYPIIHLAVGGAMQGAPVLNLSGKKYVLWVATPYWEDRKDRINSFSLPRKIYEHAQSPVLKFLEKKVIENAEHVFHLSQYTQEKISKKNYRVKSESILPYPIDTEMFSPKSSKTSESPTIFHMSRYNDPRKNVPLLLEAFKQVLEKHPDAKLVLAGDEPEKQKKRVQNLGIESSCVLLGLIRKDELLECIQNASIFVLCSKQEGLGIALLEAMSCGIPVVSTRSGGPEMFIEPHENGILIENDSSPNRLAHAINEILSQPEFAKKIAYNGRQTVIQNYSEQAAMKSVLNVYKKVYPECHLPS